MVYKDVIHILYNIICVLIFINVFYICGEKIMYAMMHIHIYNQFLKRLRYTKLMVPTLLLSFPATLRSIYSYLPKSVYRGVTTPCSISFVP